jgi:hypothetical protein
MIIKVKRGFLLLTFFMTLPFVMTGLYAQDTPEIRLKLSPLLQQGLQVISASDLDFFEQNTAEYLFDLEIWYVTQDWENTTLAIRVEKDGVPIVTLESDPFTLWEPNPPPSPGSPSYRATNIDLINTGTFPGSDISIEFDKSFQSPGEEFENYLLRSGIFQRGVYIIHTILNWGQGQAESVVRLNITNPSLIVLQTPGNFAVLDTEFPFFKIMSDATQCIFYVYKRINDDDDIETVLSGHPTLEFETSLKEFMYTITDGDPLESGATYFWYVKALVHTSHGLEDFKSNVWQFTVNTEIGSSSAAQMEQLRGLLEQLFGDQGSEIFGQLINYEPTTIQYNGESITLEKFIEILQMYGKNIVISDIEIH